ncbi:NAD(P)-binding domain-containing protein [Microbacterium sp. LRZ72]|uniref:NAD(P)-binding domain-containing protein n=1 Tax=Microbacterium sp. LRZ72 TaxID=2942481 RepID=UPI0029ADC8FC|nr:NAD(P)-binding domain-containing protein [Microbacterium sp. LRZ72]MDX2376791.1 NAD(P)-binding domain-containing protein [Microbacterium sp. LRZ72]
MTLLDLTPRTETRDRLTGLPVAVIGAGPVGLAAAANLIERGEDVVVYEKGSDAAASVRAWGHIRLFSPWRHLVDPAARRLLEREGWRMPPEGDIPDGRALVELYLAPLARSRALAGSIRTGVSVEAVTREGMDRTRSVGRAAAPFSLRLRSADGVVCETSSRAVIDASGTYDSPNPLGAGGLEALGVEHVRDRITHALPDVHGAERARFAGRHTVVVGAGHSAANTLIGLAELARDVAGTTITWLLRGTRAPQVGSSPDDELIARAQLGGRVEQLVAEGSLTVVDGFAIARAEPHGDGVRLVGRRRERPHSVDADIVVAATGFRPSLGMLREVRLDLDDIVEAPRRLAPLIDPSLHSCGTVEPHGYRELRHPDEGFFIVGMKSYGRAPTFLLATGYEQVRSVTAWLAGDVDAASAVSLSLPATGVCSTDLGGSCCT